MSSSKIQRRKKRQAKQLLRKQQRIAKLEFLWEQFLGIKDADKTYYPSHDPKVSNHRRVIGQRILSGRIKGVPNNEVEN